MKLPFDANKIARIHPLFEALDALGLGGEDICPLLNISKQCWSTWRTGERNCPKPTQICLTGMGLVMLQEGEKALAYNTLQAERKAGTPLTHDWSKKLRANLDHARTLLEIQKSLTESFSKEDHEAGEALAMSIEARLPEKPSKAPKSKATSKTTKNNQKQKR